MRYHATFTRNGITSTCNYVRRTDAIREARNFLRVSQAPNYGYVIVDDTRDNVTIYEASGAGKDIDVHQDYRF